MQIPQNLFGVDSLTGEHKVADNDPPLHQPGFGIEYSSRGLTEHFRNRSRRNLKIVRSRGIAGGEVTGKVFQIRQPDVYETFQKTQ